MKNGSKYAPGACSFFQWCLALVPGSLSQGRELAPFLVQMFLSLEENTRVTAPLHGHPRGPRHCCELCQGKFELPDKVSSLCPSSMFDACRHMQCHPFFFSTTSPMGLLLHYSDSPRTVNSDSLSTVNSDSLSTVNSDSSSTVNSVTSLLCLWEHRSGIFYLRSKPLYRREHWGDCVSCGAPSPRPCLILLALLVSLERPFPGPFGTS